MNLQQNKDLQSGYIKALCYTHNCKEEDLHKYVSVEEMEKIFDYVIKCAVETRRELNESK